MKLERQHFEVRLALNEQELLSAQRLRYRVFVTEMGAKTDRESAVLQLERDRFDPYFDHLVLLDHQISDPQERVVGVYRLMPGEVAARGLGFYGASEYDLGKITQTDRKVIELGRSCIDARYRRGIGMHLLWSGLANYVLSRDIEIMFGVASFPTTQVPRIAQALSYLHHCHLAPSDLRVRARAPHFQTMDLLDPDQLSQSQASGQLPPLIKAYLRLGGFVGEGAFIDHDFNTTDICLLMDTARMSQKHKDFYKKGAAV